MMPREVNNALIGGLQRTLAMRLPGHPPADAADGMYQAWIAAFDALPWAWSAERDVPRIEQAFALFWSRAERWPTPKMLLDCLPPVPLCRRLDAPQVRISDEQIKRNKRRLAEILKTLSQSKTTLN